MERKETNDTSIDLTGNAKLLLSVPQTIPPSSSGVDSALSAVPGPGELREGGQHVMSPQRKEGPSVAHSEKQRAGHAWALLPGSGVGCSGST